MWLGFLLVSLAGICWVGTGIVVSMCAKRGINYTIVQMLSDLILVPVCLIFAFFQGGFNCDREIYLTVLGFCFIGGIGNYFTFLLTEAAMKRGPNGLVWGIMQAGMIGTFLMGVFCFGEKASWRSWLFLFIVLAGVILSGLKKENKPEDAVKSSGLAWLWFSIAAMVCIAFTQCTVVFPSFMKGGTDAGSAIRLLGLSAGAVLAFSATTLPALLKKHEFYIVKGTWTMTILRVLISIFASIFFFVYGVDRLAAAGCGGLGYPVAIGVCLIGFSVYSLCILREKLTKVGLIGLLSIILGIIGMSMR